MRVRQSVSHRPPMSIKANAMVGISGGWPTAPGSAPTVFAHHAMPSMPQAIGFSAIHSSPNGIRIMAPSAAGITMMLQIGMAIMFASTAYC